MAMMQRTFYRIVRDKRQQRRAAATAVMLLAFIAMAMKLSDGQLPFRPASPSAFVATTQPVSGVRKLSVPIHTHSVPQQRAGAEDTQTPSEFLQAAKLDDLPDALVDPTGSFDTLAGDGGGESGGGLTPGGTPSLFGPSGNVGGGSQGDGERADQNNPGENGPGDKNAVPEPASWIMMILGIGAIGYVQRRRALGAPLVSG